MQARAGFRGNILVAHVGRIADDGIEPFRCGEIEKVHDRCPRRCNAGIQFDGGASRQMTRKRALSRRWFERAPLIRAQVQHGAHDGFGGKNLAERSDIQVWVMVHAGTYMASIQPIAAKCTSMDVHYRDGCAFESNSKSRKALGNS